MQSISLLHTYIHTYCALHMYICTHTHILTYSSYTKSINDDELTLTTKQSTDRNFITMYKHYVGDGLYLWRYRINRELENLSIIIKLRGEHVGDSPYKLGNVLTEKCHCPSRTIDEWLADFQCQSNYEQIESNLRPYKAKGIQINDLYEKVKTQFSRSHGVHYSIINNQVQIMYILVLIN